MKLKHKTMEQKYRRFSLLIDYRGKEGKLNEDASIHMSIFSESWPRLDIVYKRDPSKGTHFGVDILIESGTPIPIAAKQARDFVIIHRETEYVIQRISEDEYDDLIYTLDSMTN
jgi:hypothetical protein